MATYSQGEQTSRKNGQVINSILDINCTREKIFVFPGSLSPNDIMIKYKTLSSRPRTPKHIHFTIDLLIKKEHQPKLTTELVDTLLTRWECISPLTNRNYTSIYNNLIISKDINIINAFSELNNYGNYSVEFLLNFAELIMLQEKTNFPGAFMFKKVLTSIKENIDIYSIVSTATHNGR